MMEKISFTDTAGGGEMDLYVLEQTSVNGCSYVLAAEDPDDDCVAYILKEVREEEENAYYAIVDNDIELDAVSGIFAEMLEDVSFTH